MERLGIERFIHSNKNYMDLNKDATIVQLLEQYTPEEILNRLSEHIEKKDEPYITFDELKLMLEVHKEIVAKDVFEGLRNYYEKALLEKCSTLIQEGVETFLREHKVIERLSQLEQEYISENIVIIEEMDKEEAKNKISKYMEENRTADTEELMENLKIDLRLLVEILDELREEGVLVEADIE